MSNNSTVELIKIPAPKGYNAKHVWAIVKDGKQYGEIVPDMGRNGTIGYTVYTAAGVEHYSLLAGGRSYCRITLAAALSACKQAARNMVRWEEEAAAEAAAPVAEPAAPAPAASLVTEQERIEVRDAATCAWNECADCDLVTVHMRHTQDYLRSIGLMVGADERPEASCTVTLYLADHLGNRLTLEWDPMQDGFEIDEATCDGCDRSLPADEVEPCGDSEGFAFCAACRKRDEEPPAHLMSDRTAGDWVSPPTRQDQLEGRG